MDKIAQKWRDISLKKSLVFYVSVFTALALILSVATVFICNRLTESIIASYPSSGEKYYLTNEKGEQLGKGAFIGDTPLLLSEEDTQRIALLELLPNIAPPLYSALCIIAAALLFYNNKLKRPLEKLNAASEKISNNDLDFTLVYGSKDELGQLCASFEHMRAALADNIKNMWRQLEEREKLNAAFAHDLRTPLTVLTGYSEMLETSENVKTKEIASVMALHIARMEGYINSMTGLRCLEDASPKYDPEAFSSLLFALKNNAEIICDKHNKTLIFRNDTPLQNGLIDADFVSKVVDNLITNAARYARTTVLLSLEAQPSGLMLTVEDDGKGFDSSCLDKVTAPYFTQEEHSEHFGLGLYICKVLCERHGGYLSVENSSDGARVIAFFKYLACR